MRAFSLGSVGTMIAAMVVAGLAGPAVAGAQPQVMPTATTTKGDLRITLTGLPAGVRANLTVTRAGYVVRPTRAITLANLVPAVYTVTATPSVAGGKAYVPTPASARVGVVARGVRTVAITYRAVTAPGSPTVVSALSVGDGTKTSVTWLPPALTGGQVLGYTAVAAPGGRSCTTTGAATCTITGLARGGRYTVSVRTRNAAGTSGPAIASMVTKSCLTVAARANLAGCSMVGAKLAGRNLTGANLTGSNLTGADLFGTNLTGANVTGVTLSRTDLRQATLAGANVTDAVMTGANIDRSVLTPSVLKNLRSGALVGTPGTLTSGYRIVAGYLVGPGVNLTAASLSGADLSAFVMTGADFARADLAGANLTGAGLNQTNLTAANLHGARLTGAHLAGAKLAGTRLESAAAGAADLTGADVQDATLTEATLTGATLVEANFSRANLTGANLTDANPHLANLTYATLTSSNLTRVDLTTSNLGGIRSGGISGTPGALPTGWIVAGGYLIGPGASLAGANLEGLNVRGADLRETSLVGVRTFGMTADPAFLPPEYTEAGRTYVIPCPGGWVTSPYWPFLRSCPSHPYAGQYFSQTAIVGPGVDLSGLNLARDNAETGYLMWPFPVGFDFRGANLSGANFARANLSGANLSGANLSGATWTDGHLCAPGSLGACA